MIWGQCCVGLCIQPLCYQPHPPSTLDEHRAECRSFWSQSDSVLRVAAVLRSLQTFRLVVCRPRRSDIEILAGTVACPQCCGKGQYQRHTPNFARFFGLQEPWQDEVSCRDAMPPAHQRSVSACRCGV